MELGKNDKKGCVTMRRIKDEFLKGVSLTPAFIIEPTDEEYENSENLFGFDEAEFYEKIKSRRISLICSPISWNRTNRNTTAYTASQNTPNRPSCNHRD